MPGNCPALGSAQAWQSPVVLATSLVVMRTSSQLHQGTVYSVAALRANLTHHGSTWTGRTVLVRGYLAGCPHPVCPGHEPGVPPSLVDPNDTEVADPLPLTWSSPSHVWAFLRHVPLLGSRVPALQVLQWGVVATYRVQIRVLPADSCPFPPCYKALLLDATPGSR